MYQCFSTFVVLFWAFIQVRSFVCECTQLEFAIKSGGDCQSHIALRINYGSIWIEFILLKLRNENWKHCSKIIFKCVNSIVDPFLMKKLLKNVICETRQQCTDILFTANLVKRCGWNKKKIYIYIYIYMKMRENIKCNPGRRSEPHLHLMVWNHFLGRWVNFHTMAPISFLSSFYSSCPL